MNEKKSTLEAIRGCIRALRLIAEDECSLGDGLCLRLTEEQKTVDLCPRCRAVFHLKLLDESVSLDDDGDLWDEIQKKATSLWRTLSKKGEPSAPTVVLASLQLLDQKMKKENQ
jgi:hypothetical protein